MGSAGIGVGQRKADFVVAEVFGAHLRPGICVMELMWVDKASSHAATSIDFLELKELSRTTNVEWEMMLSTVNSRPATPHKK